MSSEISIQYLNECFNYDPHAGILRWKKRPLSHFINSHRYKLWNSVHPYKIAGWISSQNRLNVCINSKSYLGHRIIWAIYYKKWPEKNIDHIDRNPMNNKIANLRECTPRQNQYNRIATKANKLGIKGVHQYAKTKKYRAQINIDGEVRHLGYFKNILDAHNAYCRAAKKHHGEFYHR